MNDLTGTHITRDEPHDRMTHVANIAADKVHEHYPDLKVVILVDDDTQGHGGFAAKGFDDEDDLRVHFLRHISAFARTVGL